MLLCAALALLAAAPPAAGATISLRDDLRASGVALAGPDVFVMRERRNGTTELVAVPRTGGPARTLLSVPSVQPVFESQGHLSASDARVALITEILDRRDRTVEWRVYSGPPSGPFQIVRRIPDREGWEPLLVDVDGDRVLIVEARLDEEVAVRAYILDPAFGLVPVAWAKDSAIPVAIAGGRAAAYAERPRRVAVVDLGTGAEQAAVRVGSPTERLDVDLAADGRVVVAARDGIAVASPGAAPQTVPGSRDLSRTSFAGAAIAAFDDGGHPVLVGFDGARTALGPPSRVLTAFAGDPQGFAWVANGCIRYAALPVTASAPQAGDPCPTTEIGLAYIAHAKLRGRTVRVPVLCVTAANGVCRGTVLGREARAGAGSSPAGASPSPSASNTMSRCASNARPWRGSAAGTSGPSSSTRASRTAASAPARTGRPSWAWTSTERRAEESNPQVISPTGVRPGAGTSPGRALQAPSRGFEPRSADRQSAVLAIGQ